MVFRKVIKSNGTQLVEESESDFDVTFASLTSRTEQLGSEITANRVYCGAWSEGRHTSDKTRTRGYEDPESSPSMRLKEFNRRGSASASQKDCR